MVWAADQTPSTMRPRHVVSLIAISCNSHRNGACALSTTRRGPSARSGRGGPTDRRNVIAMIDDNPQCEEETSAARRRLLLSTMAIAVATVSLDGPANGVEVQEDDVPTTPSVIEGELAVSQPPPNRTVDVSDQRPDQKKNNSRSGFFVAGGASGS